jgi:hypothetical protein
MLASDADRVERERNAVGGQRTTAIRNVRAARRAWIVATEQAGVVETIRDRAPDVVAALVQHA